MATSNSVLHHDVLLTNYVQRWTPPKDLPWYMQDKLFPPVPVDKASNVFKVINQSTWMKTAPSVVGPSGDVSVVQPYYDPEGSFKTLPYAQDGIIDHLERDEADDVALYEQLVADLPMVIMKNTMEIDAVNVLVTTANLGVNFETVAVGDMFDNYGSLTGNPLLYIWAKAQKIMAVTGRKLNFLGVDRLTWRSMQFHPAVQQIAPVHTMPAGLQAIPKELFEKKLEDVLEPGSIQIIHYRYDKSRTPSTQGNLVPSAAIGPNLVMGYFTPNATREDISATKQFQFVGKRDLLSGAALLAKGASGQSIEVPDDIAGGAIAAFTYPLYNKGQRGSTGVRVLTNRAFNITRSSSLWVSFGVVDKNNAGLYGTELL